ncbi:MAG: replication-associated recombination protein A [Pirellulaceae bacterium]
MNLFEAAEKENEDRAKPLAARMRPQSLSEFVGQRHLLGPDTLLSRLIKADRLGSLLLFGPPGTGKTTLARLLAQETRREFVELSAILHGVKELREVLQRARDRLAASGDGTLLFIDEIHRFNRSQQDALLADVEQGVVTLVGATTSNPFFAVNSALVSRSQLLEFKQLEDQDLIDLLNRAIRDTRRGLGDLDIDVDDDVLQSIVSICDGDARKALSVLETAVLSAKPPVKLTRELVGEATLYRAQRYDVSGDEHYDCASALIKSIRGSDPDAAVYWLARMLEGGEDVRFLCRRLVILASEDIGNADPSALPLAVSCFQACEQVGLPECQFALAQTAIYLAMAPKSNSATVAIGSARADVRTQAVLPVPKHLQDGHYAGAKELGHGVGYQYSHNATDGVAAQDYLGVEREYYHPVDRGNESDFSKHLAVLRARLRSK